MNCKNCEIGGCENAVRMGQLEEALKLAVEVLHHVGIPNFVIEDTVDVMTKRMEKARKAEKTIETMTGINYYKDCFELPFSPRMADPV